MRKCRGCLCQSCLNTCCDRKNCTGKRGECEHYAGFVQLRFDLSIPPKQHKKSPRYSLGYYGITKQRYRELKALTQSGRYDSLARHAAYRASESIAEYILLSVMKNKSYEGVEYAEQLGRIPCGRTDFYGYRRLTYHFMDIEFVKMGL